MTAGFIVGIIAGVCSFAANSGAIADEVVMEYIKNQDEDADKRGDDFTILET